MEGWKAGRTCAETKRRVGAALEIVGLSHLADRRPLQLSGGQQQRVVLARTMVIEPKVLLLDEPLSNLDAKMRVQVRRELRDLQQRLGLTTIFVTHDQEEANTVCDRIAVMSDGVVLTSTRSVPASLSRSRPRPRSGSPKRLQDGNRRQECRRRSPRQ